jgi:hypothetical protein
MKNYFKQFAVAAILIISIHSNISCDLKKGNNVLTIQKDTLIVDIPKNDRGNYRLMYRECKRDEKLLGLDSLQIGFDSLQIRIWFEPGLYYKKQMIILKNSNNIWVGQLISWSLNYGKEDSPSYNIVNKNIENVSPRSGWDKYIAKLVSLNILTLPDDSEIKGIESGGGDLRMTAIEIAAKNLYRFYTYTEPDGYTKKFKELEDMENIIHYTEKEFPQLLIAADKK